MAEPLDDADRADLAALADGTLPPERRDEVEARVAASDVLRAELDAQRAVLAAVRAGEEDRAPERLRAWLADQPASAPEPEPVLIPPARPRPRRRLSPAALRGGLLAAAAAVVLALVLTSGGASLQDVADAAAQAPVSGPPARADAGALAVEGDGLPFPDWEHRGWRAVGVRTDTVDGRRTTTVTYERGDGDRLHYAIVPRPVVEDTPPEGFGLTELDGKGAVVWELQGRTCLLISSRVERDTLVELARATTRRY